MKLRIVKYVHGTERGCKADDVMNEFIQKGYKCDRTKDELYNDVIRISW